MAAEADVDAPPLIERINDVARVNELIWTLSRDAGEVLAMHPGRRRVPHGRLPGFVDRLVSGVSWRTIVSHELLRDPASTEYCRRLHEAGDHHRVTGEPVRQMVILGREIAFVPAAPDAPTAGALMIRQAGAVATLVNLFEHTWAHATDLDAMDVPEPSAYQREILRLLAAATLDETAARALGLGVRTYRRHVAELLVALKAANRLQAAVIAQQRGWI